MIGSSHADELHSADPRILGLAEELLRLVSELYGAGLERVVELGPGAGPGPDGRAGRRRGVASLFLVQGLHPERSRPGWRRRWGSVRPFLVEHGGDVELLGSTRTAVR